MPPRWFIVPWRLRQRLYKRRRFYWHRALVRYARNDAGELRRLDARLREDEHPRDLWRRVLRRRIARYLRTAAPEPPARSPALRVLRDAGMITDSTAFERQTTTVLLRLNRAALAGDEGDDS